MAPIEAESANSLSGTKPQDAVTAEIMAIVDDHMRRPLSTRLLLFERRGSAHCKMIRDANKVKRLDWAKVYISNRYCLH